MGSALTCLLLLMPVLGAQPDILDPLTDHIKALSVVPRLPHESEVFDPRNLSSSRQIVEFKILIRTQAPEFSKAMDLIARDVQEEYGRALMTWNFAFTLTDALAGRPVSEVRARRLAVTIVGALDNALLCQKEGVPLRGSLKFRDAVNNAFLTLLDLGVSRRSSAIVAQHLVSAADQIVTGPVFRPLS